MPDPDRVGPYHTEWAGLAWPGRNAGGSPAVGEGGWVCTSLPAAGDRGAYLQMLADWSQAQLLDLPDSSMSASLASRTQVCLTES